MLSLYCIYDIFRYIIRKYYTKLQFRTPIWRRGIILWGESLREIFMKGRERGHFPSPSANLVGRRGFSVVKLKAAAIAFIGVFATSAGTVFAQTQPSNVLIAPVTVRVQSGNTLWGLSSSYHVPVLQLEHWNHLRDDSTLQIGQKVIVGWSRGGSISSLSGRDESLSASYSTAVLGEQIGNYAKQFLGVPYRWGGESVSGFDCSGFVRFTFGHFNVGLGRSSFDQYQQGAFVSESSLQPGDLVFFSSNGSGPSHVGIYLGGGQFINVEDRGVTVDSIDSSYWSTCYYGARRVIS